MNLIRSQGVLLVHALFMYSSTRQSFAWSCIVHIDTRVHRKLAVSKSIRARLEMSFPSIKNNPITLLSLPNV